MANQVKLEGNTIPPSHKDPLIFRCMKIILSVSSLALFVIGCLSGAGVIQNPTIGWVAAGVAGEG